MAESRTVRVTLAFTDIAGSTKHVERLGDAYLSVLEQHRQIVRDEVEPRGGRLFGTEGDACFLVFESARNAIEALAAIQRGMASRQWDHPVKLRIGAHTGDALEVDGDYLGLTVHRASRVASAAHGGQLVCTDATRAEAGDAPKGTTWRALGEHRLRDMQGTELIHQLSIDGLPDTFPPLRTPGAGAPLLTGCRVVVAEDMVLLRAGVVRLLQEAGADVVGEVETAEGLLAVVAQEHPDLALIDIKMPPTHTEEGLVAATAIRKNHPDTAALLLSSYLDARYASLLIAAHPARCGYLLKDTMTDADALVDAIRRVLDGECVIDPAIVAQLLARPRTADPLESLTARETEILGLMAEGFSNRAICERLFLSGKTVESHVRSVFAKLELTDSPDASRRVQAVLAYLRT